MIDAARLIALPIGLGLFGFIEPCSIGASLLFIKSLERHAAPEKIMQVALFTILSAVLMGALVLLGFWSIWFGLHAVRPMMS